MLIVIGGLFFTTMEKNGDKFSCYLDLLRTDKSEVIAVSVLFLYSNEKTRLIVIYTPHLNIKILICFEYGNKRLAI